MDYGKINDELDAIAERCETEDDVVREVALLSPEDKFKMVHSLAKDNALKEIQKFSNATIEFLDVNELVNDYELGVLRREPLLGILSAVTGIYNQSTDLQGRRELQCQTASTQYALEHTNYATDLSAALLKIVREIVATEIEYAAVLKGRSFGVHFTDEQANFVPYSEEGVSRENSILKEREKEHNENLAEVRGVLEKNYWGEGELPELEPGGCAQTILPLWSVGYTPERE